MAKPAASATAIPIVSFELPLLLGHRIFPPFIQQLTPDWHWAPTAANARDGTIRSERSAHLVGPSYSVAPLLGPTDEWTGRWMRSRALFHSQLSGRTAALPNQLVGASGTPS